MSEPITVSIRREVDPGRITEATVWVQTGVNLATKYPGFLGSGWVRAGEDSQIWHMLYRFANEESLVAWEKSGEREWWLSMGEGFIRSERSKRPDLYGPAQQCTCASAAGLNSQLAASNIQLVL